MKTCPNVACFEGIVEGSSRISYKGVALLPAGRATLDMGDGAILEVIVLVCPKCRTISLEHAAVATSEIPDLKNSEERDA